MTKQQRQKKFSAQFDAQDVRVLADLATRLNARPLRLRISTKIDIAARYLRRHRGFRGAFPWHKGAHHVGRYNFGPMIFESKDGLAVDPRSSAATP